MSRIGSTIRSANRNATTPPKLIPPSLLDRKVINAGNTQAHQAVLVELPILVAVAAKPIATVIVALVRETNRDAVVLESPDFLNEPVVEFTLPFPSQKRFDFRPPL